MWVAKIRVDGSKAGIGKVCKDNNLSCRGNPFQFSQLAGEFICHFIIIPEGNTQSKKSFFNALSSIERIKNLEKMGDFILGEISESLLLKKAYSYKLIHLEPVQFFEDGFELWTLGSFDRDKILGFINSVEKIHPLNILQLKKSTSINLSVLTLDSGLTPPQKSAINIAIEHGYYEVPRKVELKDLAKLLGISYSTFQVHLRKAEKKLIPHVFKKIV